MTVSDSCLPKNIIKISPSSVDLPLTLYHFHSSTPQIPWINSSILGYNLYASVLVPLATEHLLNVRTWGDRELTNNKGLRSWVPVGTQKTTTAGVSKILSTETTSTVTNSFVHFAYLLVYWTAYQHTTVYLPELWIYLEVPSLPWYSCWNVKKVESINAYHFITYHRLCIPTDFNERQQLWNFVLFTTTFF